MIFTKKDVLEFCKANQRLPDQRIKAELRLYNAYRKHCKEDWAFKESMESFRHKPKVRKPQNREHSIMKSTIQLGLFLMDSGGTGAF